MRIRPLILHDAFSRRYDASALNIHDDPVPGIIWLGLPLFLIGVPLILTVLDQDLFIWWVSDETGVGENLTAILFILAGILAFMVAKRGDAIPLRWLQIAFYAIAVLAILVAGEEWSWGQHFAGWGTPDWVADLNKQNETNIHNMADRVLDQKPRAIISIVILIFGVLVPLFRRKISWLDDYPVLSWLMPGRLMIPAALLVILPRLVDRFQVWFDVLVPPPFYVPTRQYQEMQELFIAAFVFLYVLNIFLRVRQFARTVPEDGKIA